MAKVLSVRGVRQGYAGVDVLRGLSFELDRGRIGCVLGPSGCGKTTLLRCLAGFEPITEGAIQINGQTVSTPGRTIAPEARRIGMVFQDFALFPHLSVVDNVAFGLRATAKPASFPKNQARA